MLRWLWKWMYSVASDHLGEGTPSANSKVASPARRSEDPVLLRIRQRQRSLREELDIVRQRQER